MRIKKAKSDGLGVDEALGAFETASFDARFVAEVAAVGPAHVPQDLLFSVAQGAAARLSTGGAPVSSRPQRGYAEALSRGILEHTGHGVLVQAGSKEHMARSAHRAGRLASIVKAYEEQVPLLSRSTDFGCVVWRTRIAVHRGEVEPARRLLESIDSDFRRWWEHRGHPLVDILSNPLDVEWLGGLPAAIAVPGVSRLLEASFFDMHLGPRLGELRRHLDESVLDAQGGRLRRALAADLLARGDFEAALELAREAPGPEGGACRAAVSFLRGDQAASAARAFFSSVESTGKQTRSGTSFRSDFIGALGVMALVCTGEPENLDFAARLCEKARKGANASRFDGIFADLARAVEACRARKPARRADRGSGGLIPAGEPPAELIFGALADHVALPDRKDVEPGLIRALEGAESEAEAAGYALLADQAAGLSAKLLGRGPSRTARSGVLFCEVFEVDSRWRRALDMLGALGERETSDTDGPRDGQRLAWRIAPGKSGQLELSPMVQTAKKSGGWSKGRKLPRSSWGDPKWTERMTPAEVEALLVLSTQPEGPGAATSNTAAAAWALAGHPAVFWNDTSVELVRREPVVVVERRADRFAVELHPRPNGSNWGLYRGEPGRLEVVRLIGAHEEIAEILGDGGLSVPADQEASLRQTLEALCAVVEVHGESGEIAASAPREEAAEPDARLRVRCYPYGRGLLARLAVTPLGPEGPEMPPGRGPSAVMASVGGRTLRAARDLEAEARSARRFTRAAPKFAELDEGDGLVRASHPETALELLAELKDAPAGVLLEWPEGEALRVSKPLDASCLRFAVARREDWFEISGEAVVDEGRVVALRALLAALAGTERRRWISLGDGLYLRLTETLARQLDVLAKADLGGSEDGVTVSDAAAASLGSLVDEAGFVDADRQWRELEVRLADAKREDPAPPPGFRAELRDYQRQGYAWMVRLSRLGFGALLADDMGLGKTVQALAVLSARAAAGPALVVAPTSVCAGWLQEAARFAPRLEARSYEGDRRRRRLAAAKAGDLFVVSYGLLVRDAEVLTRVRWGTVILDEAQAIKNPDAKRSKTAYLLRGDFKLAMTGTPVENRLGDLWSMMHFLNPGLLGTRQGFAAHFEAPAQKEGFDAVGGSLKRLTAAFISRRRKQDVLEELPPRTDLIRTVTLSDKERALYELERRRVFDLLDAVDSASKPVVILSALTRLRRLCCHPSLLEPRIDAGGAKLEALFGLVRDLAAGDHRALIFSQFVDYLSLVRRTLEKEHIDYQYLDGSTPAEKRARAVRGFQEGRGRVFLISLKAGGVGLNLTAADYVIHLDPWWNPAVEDQASDRAHRMGQKRPVTVYKLVAEDTIEEKVVALHGHKRRLAEGLLEDADRVTKLDAPTLLGLIRDIL